VTPGISVILPCYNMARFLGEAVESVIAQQHPDLEIIVVDDGSTDDTAAVARALPACVRTFHQENRGPAAARNLGLTAARHELVAFVDADDLWPRDKLRLQLPRLLEDPGREFVVGQHQAFVLREGAPEGSRDYVFSAPPPHFIFLLGCGLYRRRVFDRVGVLDESMRYSEDTDWFYRCREAGLAYLEQPDVTVFYRRHAASMTHGRDVIGKGFLHALKKSIDRRRTRG
jgi:glycosyltransferase involved in cell wall biosynthesis